MVSQLLNIDAANISASLPFIVASVGSPKLLIPISANTINNLNPNYLEIEKWSIKSRVNGIYVYSIDLDKYDSFYA